MPRPTQEYYTGVLIPALSREGTFFLKQAQCLIGNDGFPVPWFLPQSSVDEAKEYLAYNSTCEFVVVMQPHGFSIVKKNFDVVKITNQPQGTGKSVKSLYFI